MPLFAERGERIRGKDQKQVAELALARLKVIGKWRPTAIPTGSSEWLVARACSDYLLYCERGVACGMISADHRASSVHYLNDLSEYAALCRCPS